MRTCSDASIVFAISLILTLSCATVMYNPVFAQMSDSLLGNSSSFLDNGEGSDEDDASEIDIPEKGVFERIEGNNTGTN